MRASAPLNLFTESTSGSTYKGANFPEDLSVLKKEAHNNIEGSNKSRIKLVICHVASKHTDLYKLLYPIFNQFKWVTEVPSVNLQPQSSPHSLSEEELESLSEEELYKKAIKDESFRRGIFLRWKQMNETKNRNQ